MGYICYKCHLIIPGPVGKLISHLHMAHALFDMPHLHLVCGQGGCPSSFTTFNSYRKHLLNQHPQEEPEPEVVQGMEGLVDADLGVAVGEVHNPAADDAFDDDDDRIGLLQEQDGAMHNDSTRPAAFFIGSLLSNTNMTHAMTNRVLSAATALNTDVVDSLRSKVIQTFEALGIDLENEECKNLLAEFDSKTNIFHGLETRYKQEQFFENILGLVKPKSIFLGFRNDSRTDGESGKSKTVPVPETFQYISILSTLGLVLGEEHVRHEIEIGHSSTNDTMHDICDGQQYKNHPLFSNNPQAIQICLYFDEFEVVNPLGSKIGIHKVGAFYINFKNLPPKWNSSLDNIHLLALCNCLDIKKYGFDSILAPFVADLRKLESEEGAEIVLPDNSVRVVRGTLSQVCGDNLGLNGLLGFVESFSANMPCRICVGRKDEFQTKFTGEEFDLRDRHTHSLHVEEVRNDAAFVANSGVKRDCILNSLQYFHVTSNVAVDIMHDILEGIAPMEVKLVLCKFIYDDHFFTLSDFNTFLSSHNYGFCDAKNKPSLILESTLRGTGHSLKQSASQM